MRAGEFTTSLEVVGGVARFHVDTSNPVYRELLLHIGFPRSDETRHSREFPASPDIARIHDNFARHLEEILASENGSGSLERPRLGGPLLYWGLLRFPWVM